MMSDHASTPFSASRVADRLASARQRRFTGREREIRLFRAGLTAPEPTWSVLFIHGPGGVGKTTLLDAFTRVARGLEIDSTIIDCRAVDPTPIGFNLALRIALGVPTDRNPLDALTVDSAHVLLLDTYETLAPLDEWLRSEFLPELPSHVRVVITSRTPPSPGWRADGGWGDLMEVISLRNFLPDESRAYLTVRHIPDHLHGDILGFTYGHPLALSLVADTVALSGAGESIPQIDDPDIIRVLLERFVRGVPSARHRQALDVCAHARVTTEALLTDVFGNDDAPALFEWLRGLSFIQQGPRGLFPHDLARDVLDADLRWRNMDRYLDIHQTVRANAVRRIQETQGIEQQWAFFDLLHLHRQSPVMRPFFNWSTLGSAYAEPATPRDHPTIIDAVLRHEGEESARIARHWLQQQPEAFIVYRENRESIIGFLATIILEQTTPEDRDIDPAIAAAHTFIQRYGPSRPGDVTLHHRFSIDVEHYQDASVSWDMDVMVSTVMWLTTPRLAWTFVTFADPDFAADLMHYVNFQRSPEAGFVVGGRTYGVFTHDWRAEPPVAWLDLMEERELALDLTPDQVRTAHPPPLVVLSQPEFEDAVRQALRNYHRPDALAASPLLRSRLVREQSQSSEPVEALRGILLAAITSLQENPRDARLYRALHRTYLAPAATQELAAEALDLPFSTYRYHLTTGIDRVTAALWHRELHSADDAAPSPPRSAN